MYGYIYLTTNLINNKKYIGQHCAESFDNSYYGSGKHLKSALRIYGKENFKCEILKECFSQEELDTSERYFIKYFNAVDSDMYYNIALGGTMCQLAYQTQETRDKIGTSNRGKKRTPDMVERNRNYRLGSRWMNNGVEQKLLPNSRIKMFEELGWHFGMLPNRKRCPSSNQKKHRISEALKNKKKSADSVRLQKESLKMRKLHWYTNGVEDILVSEFDEVPQGYKRGRKRNEEALLKNSNAHKGTIPWNKGLKHT